MSPERSKQNSQSLSAKTGAHIKDVTQVTGDLFQMFLGAPPSLRSQIHAWEFQSLINDRVRTFVGRQFVLDAVSDLIDEPDFLSGYILIRGAPGIGKTALICAIANEKGYLHHFNIAAQNIRSSRKFLENICAQLIVRYDLDHTSIPPSATEDSAFLSQLLAEAKLNSNGPVVVLVDAIDETEEEGQLANRLFLPPTLPDGVFFILTSREQSDYRLVVDRREDIYLRDDDPENLNDIRTYVSNFLEENFDKMNQAIRNWGVGPQVFTDEIVDRSQGNFMYLVHVLTDIRDGRLTPKNIQSISDLPKGLQGYYQQNWRIMKSGYNKTFADTFETVLKILATVKEAVSMEYIEELTEPSSTQVREVLSRWRQFLNEAEKDGKLVYRIYHLSFQDFLAQEGAGLRPYHERIANSALAKIPGFFDEK